jgi:hypothetical protein
VGSKQTITIEELDSDGGVGGDAVVQGDHEALTIILGGDDGESSDATDKGKCLKIRVVHLSCVELTVKQGVNPAENPGVTQG